MFPVQGGNPDGYNSTWKTECIIVIGVLTPSRIGVVRNNRTWIPGASGNGAYGAGDIVYNYRTAGARYITDDGNGNGRTGIGLLSGNHPFIDGGQ